MPRCRVSHLNDLFRYARLMSSGPAFRAMPRIRYRSLSVVRSASFKGSSVESADAFEEELLNTPRTKRSIHPESPTSANTVTL
eukprot:352399-Amphidinium_carterae.1